MCDAPWESSGPTWKEARKKYVSTLKHSLGEKYTYKMIEKYVNEFMNKKYDKQDPNPVGSYRGFGMGFPDEIEKIEKLILNTIPECC